MADQPFSLYPGDYLRDTRGLSLAEHGAYFLLLVQLYVTGRPLPANAKELHRICSAHRGAERDATDRVVKRYFERTEEGWIQKRAMAEIEKRQNISGKRSNAAKQRHSKSYANAQQTEFPSGAPVLLDLSSSSLNQDSSLSSFPEDSLGQSVKKLQGKSLGARAFDAYAEAYKARYGADPVVNAKVRSQFKQLGERLGEEAVAVAAYYLTHSSQFYTRTMHTADCLLKDAEKLRTEWATGRQASDGRRLSAVETVVEKARQNASKTALIPHTPEVKDA